MPPDPKARMITVAYSGGTVTGTRGLMDSLFPGRTPSWLPNGESGSGRRPFGSKQADNRAAGRILKLQYTSGETYTVRITGTDTRFLQTFLQSANTAGIDQVYTEAGTIYGPQYSTIGPQPVEE